MEGIEVQQQETRRWSVIASKDFSAGSVVWFEKPLVTADTCLYTGKHSRWARHTGADPVYANQLISFCDAKLDIQHAALQLYAPDVNNPSLHDLASFKSMQQTVDLALIKPEVKHALTAILAVPSVVPAGCQTAQDLALCVLCIWAANAFTLQTGPEHDNIKYALFKTGSRVAHRCGHVNLSYSNRDVPAAHKGCVKFYALADIQPGDVLTVNRIGPVMACLPQPARQRYILHKHMFTCACTSCTVGLDKGRGLPCPTCAKKKNQKDKGTLYCDVGLLRQRHATPWACDRCGARYPDDDTKLLPGQLSRAHDGGHRVEQSLVEELLDIDDTIAVSHREANPLVYMDKLKAAVDCIGHKHWVAFKTAAGTAETMTSHMHQAFKDDMGDDFPYTSTSFAKHLAQVAACITATHTFCHAWTQQGREARMLLLEALLPTLTNLSHCLTLDCVSKDHPELKGKGYVLQEQQQVAALLGRGLKDIGSGLMNTGGGGVKLHHEPLKLLDKIKQDCDAVMRKKAISVDELYERDADDDDDDDDDSDLDDDQGIRPIDLLMAAMMGGGYPPFPGGGGASSRQRSGGADPRSFMDFMNMMEMMDMMDDEDYDDEDEFYDYDEDEDEEEDVAFLSGSGRHIPHHGDYDRMRQASRDYSYLHGGAGGAGGHANTVPLFYGSGSGGGSHNSSRGSSKSQQPAAPAGPEAGSKAWMDLVGSSFLPGSGGGGATAAAGGGSSGGKNKSGGGKGGSQKKSNKKKGRK